MSIMKNPLKRLTFIGAGLIIITGLIHIIDAPDSFSDAIYKGWLFYANGLGSFVAAYGMLRGKGRWGWNLGLFIAAGSFIAYIFSRSVGLPYIPAEPDAWLEPLGVASLIAEGAFIITFIFMKRIGIGSFVGFIK
jgi:hypothetical protein